MESTREEERSEYYSIVHVFSMSDIAGENLYEDS